MPSATGLALIFGGALGNVYDRVRVGQSDGFPRFLRRRVSLVHVQSGGYRDLCWRRLAVVEHDVSGAAQEATPKMFPYLITSEVFRCRLTACWWRWRFWWRWAGVAVCAKQRGMSSEKVVNLGVYCALAGMLGAKLLMIALDPEYRAHPGGDLSRWRRCKAPGFSSAVLCWRWCSRISTCGRRGCRCWPRADIFAPGLALGHGIGRLGCFAAGCCWGKPTHLPWAVTFTNRDHYGRAAGHSAPSDAALRSAGRSDYLRDSDPR